MTETLRLGRNCSLAMAAVNPLDESAVAAVATDGKLFFFKVGWKEWQKGQEKEEKTRKRNANNSDKD